MTAMVTYTAHGYSFEVVCNAKYGEGVVVDPKTARFDDPEFIIGLKEVCTDYVYINAAETLNEWAQVPPGEFKHASDRYLEQVLDLWTLLGLPENQSNIQPEDYAKDYVNEAIAEMIIRANRAVKRQAKEARKAQTYPGYVYLIQSPTGAYKIGRTVDPNDRMKTFTVKLPFEVEYVCVIKTDDMYGLERQLHESFAFSRVNGEWFQLTPAEVEYIKGLAK